MTTHAPSVTNNSCCARANSARRAHDDCHCSFQRRRHTYLYRCCSSRRLDDARGSKPMVGANPRFFASPKRPISHVRFTNRPYLGILDIEC